MEAKAAFETLMDERKRAEYDRRLRMVNAVWEGLYTGHIMNTGRYMRGMCDNHV